MGEYAKSLGFDISEPGKGFRKVINAFNLVIELYDKDAIDFMYGNRGGITDMFNASCGKEGALQKLRNRESCFPCDFVFQNKEVLVHNLSKEEFYGIRIYWTDKWVKELSKSDLAIIEEERKFLVEYLAR